MGLKISWKLEITRPDGSIQSSIEFPGHSLVDGFIAMVQAQATGTFWTPAVRDITAQFISAEPHTTNLDSTAVAGDQTNGLVVGSVNTPVALSDFRLAGIIAHGTGVGQLSYGATTFFGRSQDPAAVSFSELRAFTYSNPVGSATIQELGVYSIALAGITRHFMTAREIIPAQTILPFQTFTSTYTVQIVLT